MQLSATELASRQLSAARAAKVEEMSKAKFLDEGASLCCACCAALCLLCALRAALRCNACAPMVHACAQHHRGVLLSIQVPRPSPPPLSPRAPCSPLLCAEAAARFSTAAAAAMKVHHQEALAKAGGKLLTQEIGAGEGGESAAGGKEEAVKEEPGQQKEGSHAAPGSAAKEEGGEGGGAGVKSEGAGGEGPAGLIPLDRLSSEGGGAGAGGSGMWGGLLSPGGSGGGAGGSGSGGGGALQSLLQSIPAAAPVKLTPKPVTLAPVAAGGEEEGGDGDAPYNPDDMLAGDDDVTYEPAPHPDPSPPRKNGGSAGKGSGLGREQSGSGALDVEALGQPGQDQVEDLAPMIAAPPPGSKAALLAPGDLVRSWVRSHSWAASCACHMVRMQAWTRPRARSCMHRTCMGASWGLMRSCSAAALLAAEAKSAWQLSQAWSSPVGVRALCWHLATAAAPENCCSRQGPRHLACPDHVCCYATAEGLMCDGPVIAAMATEMQSAQAKGKADSWPRVQEPPAHAPMRLCGGRLAQQSQCRVYGQS